MDKNIVRFPRGNCLNNACIESFFSHLKIEKIYLNKAANKAEVEQQVGEYILFHNQNRFQKKLNDRSPVELMWRDKSTIRFLKARTQFHC
ncbi:IS3 family transposase [Paenibacillus sp. NPDC057886]|uniref:IS3 family transposase n=1 Tax=Paenibacillus sp. NPDC057886 TaxID=3346270 RepID=UPI0036C92BDD